LPIRLSDHFTYKRILRFTLPSVLMMIFTSIYGVVDGLFVSNFVGKTPFAAINLIMPFLMVLGTLGFMVGAGGNAVVSKAMGEGDGPRANRYFSLLVVFTVVCGIVLAAIGLLVLTPVCRLLGADDAMLPYCVKYGRIILLSLTAFMLQNVFQSFLITAEQPKLGLFVTVGAGCTNMVLDFVFIALFGLGVEGAALATAISQCVGGLVPLAYFFGRRGRVLHFTRPRLEWQVLQKTITNGSSELMSNISMSLVGMLYNLQLIRLAGENGVAAYGVMMYVNFIFISIFIGYSIGSAPVVGYHYGAKNKTELQSLLKKSLILLAASGIALTAIGAALASPLTGVFVGYDAELAEMTRHGFSLYSLSFFFSGFAIFFSSFFTALGNGAVSAAISFLRTLVFQIAAVFLLPLWLGLDGIWLSVVAAEVASVAIGTAFLLGMRKKYGYL